MDSDGYGCVCVIWAIAFVIALVTFMFSGCGQQSSVAAATDDVTTLSQDSPDVSPTIEHANECPLDAVAYDAPAFTSSWNDVYKVTDRFSGQSWWMVRMDGKWVVLPIESKEAVDVG